VIEPVIGTSVPEPNLPVVWAYPPPARPVDPDSLAPDALERHSLRSGGIIAIWCFQAVLFFVILLFELVPLFVLSPMRGGGDSLPAGVFYGILLYDAAGIVVVALATPLIIFTMRGRPKPRWNHVVAMFGMPVMLASGLPWAALAWVDDAPGVKSPPFSGFLLVMLILVLIMPPQPPTKRTLAALRQGWLPMRSASIGQLISYLRYRRGDWRFPVGLATSAQVVITLALSCALFGPFLLGWARPVPYGWVYLVGDILLIAFSGLLVWRTRRRFTGGPRHIPEIVVGVAGMIVGVTLFIGSVMIPMLGLIMGADVLSQPNQFSLAPSAGSLLYLQSSFLFFQPVPEQPGPGQRG
jgi:hypothetical protein